MAAGTTRLDVRTRRRRRINRRDLFCLLFVHLDGPMELIANRMELRSGHFMPRSLLPSQFDTLETLEGDENGITLDISHTIEELDKQVLAIAQRRANAGGHE